MINYVFAAEFDILKGCIIKSHYPGSFVSFNDGMLASYMIPDGAHKHEVDLNVFRYKLKDSKFQFDRQSLLINTSNVLIKTLKFDSRFERWEPVSDGETHGDKQSQNPPKVTEKTNAFVNQKLQNESTYQEKRQSINKESDFHLQMNIDEWPTINKVHFSDKFNMTLNFHPSKDSGTTRSHQERRGSFRKQSGTPNQVLKIRNYKNFQILSSPEEDAKVLLDIEIHKDFQFTRLNECFCSFYTKDGASFGFNFVSKESAEAVTKYVNDLELFLEADSQGGDYSESNFFFYNVVKTKKDQNLKRGSLIRSIAVCSRDLNCLSFLHKLILNYLEVYLKFALNEEHSTSLDKILQEIYKLGNEVVSELPASMIKTPMKGSLVQVPFEIEENSTRLMKKIKVAGGRVLELQIEQSFYRNFVDASLLDLVKRFREKTMIIYNSILREEKILFVGYECPIRDLASLVCATAYMVFPLNVFDKIYPYEHLLNMEFVQEESYIAGVSNPLFISRKNWWDICCDISNGSIIEAGSQGGAKPGSNLTKLISKSPEELGDLKLAYLDNDFILGILRKIKENDITEFEIRSYFYEYTRNFIDLYTNSNNLLDYEKDDKVLLDALQRRGTKFKKTRFFDHCLAHPDSVRAKLSTIFGEKYISLYKTINLLKEKRILNDYELIFIYSTLYENMDSEMKIKEVLELVVTGKYCTEALSAGLFSSNEDVTRKTLALFEILEADSLGQKIIKKFNYYILFVYQNMRNRLYNNEHKH